VAVLLEVGAAAGGVDDDGLDAGRLEGRDHRLGEAERLGLPPPCADSAPQQPCRCGTTTSQPSAARHAHGRGVDVGEERALHAAGQQPDGAAAGADRSRAGRDGWTLPSLGASDSIACSGSGSRDSSPLRASSEPTRLAW
jgi:hypothetical protein